MGQLMEVQRLYLDANVLIALGEGTDEVANLLTDLAAQQEPSETPFLCTSELTLSEILVQPYREQNGWLISGSFMEVAPVNRATLWYAAVVRSEYTSIKLPDAIHVATAIGLGCSHMLTADQRLKDITLFHTRYRQSRGQATLQMLRPEPDTLRTIIELQGNA
jgi:predicted nucleic acid-binding protein